MTRGFEGGVEIAISQCLQKQYNSESANTTVVQDGEQSGRCSYIDVNSFRIGPQEQNFFLVVFGGCNIRVDGPVAQPQPRG